MWFLYILSWLSLALQILFVTLAIGELHMLWTFLFAFELIILCAFRYPN